jgi:hypothetical protein
MFFFSARERGKQRNRKESENHRINRVFHNLSFLMEERSLIVAQNKHQKEFNHIVYFSIGSQKGVARLNTFLSINHEKTCRSQIIQIRFLKRFPFKSGTD